MDSQKGSVKDHLRARFLYLEYKKNKYKKLNEIKKKRKEEYQARIRAEQIRLYGKPYSKVKAFSLTLIGFLIGLIVPKVKKNPIEQKLEIIDKEKEQIFLHLEQDKDIKEIYTKIDNVYQKLENVKKEHKTQLILNSFNPRNNNNLLKKIDDKQKELIIINEICHKKENDSKKSEQILDNNKVNDFSKKDIVKKSKLIIDTNNIENKSLKIENTNIDNQNVLTGKDILKIIKDMNGCIKEYSKELDYLNDKVLAEELYRALFDYEFKLKQLKIRLNKILEDYNLLDEEYCLEDLNEIIDIDVIDKFELRKNNKTIIKKIDECNNLLNIIEEKKKGTSKHHDTILDSKKENSKSSNNSEKEVLKKNNKNEEKKKILLEEFDDVYLANKIIINNIIEEKKNLDRIKRKVMLQTSMVRKRSIFDYAKSFTMSFLHFGLSLFPIKYFKNKLMGTLVSSIMLNNSLRTTRKILSYNTDTSDYIIYNDVVNNINSNQEYTAKIYDMCIDSQNQIINIKENLNINFAMLREYDYELLDFNNQLDKLYDDLERQALQLRSMNDNYKNIKRKIKIRNDINY